MTNRPLSPRSPRGRRTLPPRPARCGVGREVQRRADRRHLPQRRGRARPQSGSRCRAAGPEGGQEPAGRRQRPKAQRSCNGRDHCLTIRLPGTRQRRRVVPPCPNDRGPGQRQPCASAGPSACPKGETKAQQTEAGPAILSGRPHRRRAAGTGCCRRVPGHPSRHGANIGAHWSIPICHGMWSVAPGG